MLPMPFAELNSAIAASVQSNAVFIFGAMIVLYVLAMAAISFRFDGYIAAMCVIFFMAAAAALVLL